MSEVLVTYCNDARISSRYFDFLFEFGIRHATGSMGEQNWIYMSPQHAKAFSVALKMQLEKYEEAFGEIKLPTPEEMKRLTEQGLVREMNDEKKDG